MKNEYRFAVSVESLKSKKNLINYSVINFLIFRQEEITMSGRKQNRELGIFIKIHIKKIFFKEKVNADNFK